MHPLKIMIRLNAIFYLFLYLNQWRAKDGEEVYQLAWTYIFSLINQWGAKRFVVV